MPESYRHFLMTTMTSMYVPEFCSMKALHRTGEMKQWEGKEIANIMNNAIEGWKPHGTHRLERNMEYSGHGNG